MALAVAATQPAMAQATVVAVGVPLVGTSAGQSCNSVDVGGLQMAVPNTDANAAAFLESLRGAEARKQVVQAVAPAPLNNQASLTQCGADLNPNVSGSTVTHLIAFK